MRFLARIAYEFILQLHPQEFRAEFGKEMLWIFDEQMRCVEDGGACAVLCAQLLIDALRSAFVQRALREQRQPRTLGPHFAQMSSSGYGIHVAEGSLVVFSCLFNVFSIVLCLHMVMSSL